MKSTKASAPLMSSTYNRDFIPKTKLDNDECPYKMLKQFEYKSKDNDLNKNNSTYKAKF